MNRTIISIFVISAFAALLSAQDDAAYMAAMKAVNASNRPLRAAVTAKDVAAASAEATKIAAAFDTVKAYWTAKKVDDAIKLATTAHDAAKTIADAKDADTQAAALPKLSGTCMACHSVHRGGQAPDFEIK